MVRIRKTKEARNRQVREALLQGAAEIVGERGYAGASVQRIADAAGIAQGTFYLYFTSRQDLFDELLPFIAHRALEHLRENVSTSQDFFEREEKSFEAFFAYLLEHPYYYRVLGEAETMAPLAFENWFKFITSRYTRNIERAVESGEIAGLSRNQARFMGVVLLACRRYVYQEFVKSSDGPRPLQKWVTAAYVDMLRRSLGVANGTTDKPVATGRESIEQASGRQTAKRPRRQAKPSSTGGPPKQLAEEGTSAATAQPPGKRR